MKLYDFGTFSRSLGATVERSVGTAWLAPALRSCSPLASTSDDFALSADAGSAVFVSLCKCIWAVYNS